MCCALMYDAGRSAQQEWEPLEINRVMVSLYNCAEPNIKRSPKREDSPFSPESYDRASGLQRMAIGNGHH